MSEDHFTRLARLLELEAEAEALQRREELARLRPAEAERRGLSLLGLVVRDERAGLGGRVVLRLGKRSAREPLPWTRLGVGGPVLLTAMGSAAPAARGVVSRLEPDAIEIALPELPDTEDGATAYRLDQADDETARKRQRAALERARSARGDRLAELREVLLGRRAPQFRRLEPLEPLDASLDASQLEAVRFALSAQDVAIVHGPPGTGKTTTVVELIRQAVRRGERVLACAPSNLAVDNLLERLVAAGERAVRLGHPARVLPALQAHTLDLLVEADPDVRLARKLVREAHALRQRAARWTRSAPEPGARAAQRAEAGRLRSDARRLEQQVVERVLDRAAVLCATTTGLDPELLGRRSFDLVVVDEAAQSTEPGCWIPLTRGRRLVLAGDHCQLPPTVVSQAAAREGLGRSLQERLAELHGPQLARLLTVQYRMHTAIMEFSSAEFYGGALVADASVAGHLLADLPGVAANELTTRAVLFVDTAGASYDEQLEPGGESRLNPEEAEVAARKVRELLDAGLAPAKLALITPYAAQARRLRELLALDGLEIDSVDGFQGREKEAVVVSLVRSNPDGQIGFLADVRRTNVALTRARRALIVVGDSATIGGHPFYRRLVEYFEAAGAYRTVWEEP